MKNSILELFNLESLSIFDEISKESRKEKYSQPPITSLHYWWTRKPLILSKASIVFATMDNFENVKNILKFDESVRSYENPLEIKQIGDINPKDIKILDPFAGSGNLIFEAARLGFDCTVSDYNPISTLILKTIYEYSKLEKLEDKVREIGTKIIEKTRNDLSLFYESEKNQISSYLWCWCIICPHCGQRFPLTNNMWISRKRFIGFEINPKDDLNFDIKIIKNISENDANKFTQKGGKAQCIKCNNGLDYEVITDAIKNNPDRQIIIIKTENGDEPFIIPTKIDIENNKKSIDFLKNNLESFLLEDLVPIENIKPDPRSGIINHGIVSWQNYFGDRQLLAQITILKNIREFCSQIKDKQYQKAIITSLSFMLSKHVDANSLGVHWHTGAEGPELTLAFRRPNFVYNHAESNPFSKARGNLYSILDEICNAIKFCKSCNVSAKIANDSVLQLDDEKFDIIFADPPNLNDIQFAELSEFFYVWVYRCLKGFVDIPKEIPIEEDFSDSPGRFGDRKLASQFYDMGLKNSIQKLETLLKNDGIILLFVNPNNMKSWKGIIEALYNAKLHATSLNSVNLQNITNIMPHLGTDFLSSVIITCRKQNKSENCFYEEITPMIEKQIQQNLDSLNTNRLFSLSLSELMLLSHSQMLSLLTKYEEIKSQKKDFEIDFESIVFNVEQFTVIQILNKITEKSPVFIGSEFLFYFFIRLFYDDEIPSYEVTRALKYFKLNINGIKILFKENNNYKIKKLSNVIISEQDNEIDSSDIFEQLCFCYQGIEKKQLDIIPSHFQKDKLKIMITVLIRIKSQKKEFDGEMEILNKFLNLLE